MSTHTLGRNSDCNVSKFLYISRTLFRLKHGGSCPLASERDRKFTWLLASGTGETHDPVVCRQPSILAQAGAFLSSSNKCVSSRRPSILAQVGVSLSLSVLSYSKWLSSRRSSILAQATMCLCVCVCLALSCLLNLFTPAVGQLSARMHGSRRIMTQTQSIGPAGIK